MDFLLLVKNLRAGPSVSGRLDGHATAGSRRCKFGREGST
jgi:hypothetical protein